MRRYLWLFVALAACAKGGAAGDDTTAQPDAPGQAVDSSPLPIDGPPIPIDGPPGSIDGPPAIDAMPIDAMPIDGPPTPVNATLSQSTATTIDSPSTVECSTNDVNNIPLYSDANHFYRAFSLTASGVNGQFTAQRVNLGIESASTTAGNQPITITLSTVAGSFPGGTLTQIGSQTFTITDTSQTIVPLTFTTPAIAPAGSTVVIDVFTPGFSANNNFFYPGSNAAGESGPSYIAASDCGVTTPSTFASLGFPVDLVFTIDGTTP